jgi:hypothetical protein
MCLTNFARLEARTEVWLGSGLDCIIHALNLDLVVNFRA